MTPSRTGARRCLRLLGLAAALAAAAVTGPYAGIDGPAPADLLPAPARAHAGAPPRVPRDAPRVVRIVARDDAFEAPDTVGAGRTELQLVDRGAELHEAALWRLDPGRTASAFLAALAAGGPAPGWAHAAGGPNSPAPGGTSAAIVDLVPGTYVVVCLLPGSDGVRHVAKGMSHVLTVVPAGGPDVAGAPDVVMRLTDYAFALSRPLTRGRHVLHVVNAGPQLHEVVVARLAPGRTARDVAEWSGRRRGPPPFIPLGGTAGMAPGATNDVALDFAPGAYVLLCLVPDAKDGRPHVAHGMIREFAVR